MVLNKEEIRKEGIVKDLDDKYLRNASYDLTTISIIDMDGKEHKEFYKLPPQGMVYVVFKEQLRLSKFIIGFAHVKTSLTKKGVMATNIGIIDPGYKGFMSTLLINFGSSDETLLVGEPYLRVTFSRLNDYSSSDPDTKVLDFSGYVKDKRKDTDNLGPKFLNISSVNEDVFKRVIKTFIGLGIIFSAASFAISIYFQNKSSSDKDLDKAIDRTEYILSENERMRKELQLLIKRADSIQVNSKISNTINSMKSPNKNRK